MAITLAFDVYGTLIDTQGIVGALEPHVGQRADEFSRLWRETQLTYAFRRGLMQNYEDFETCTRQALDYVCIALERPLDDSVKEGLMRAYRTLPIFEDVEAGLTRARDAGFRLFAFSNGTAEAVRQVLAHAGILERFDGIVSVDDVRSFKPNPGVYAHFLRRSGATGEAAWLVSSNPFDVVGARSAGMRAAWVRRSQAVPFDPWGIEPTLTLHALTELTDAIRGTP